MDLTEKNRFSGVTGGFTRSVGGGIDFLFLF